MQKEQNPAKSQTRYLEMFKSYIFYYSWILKINGEITSSIDINKPANVADINKALETIRNEIKWVRRTFVTDEQKIYMLKAYRAMLFNNFLSPEEWTLEDESFKKDEEFIKILPTLKKIYEYNQKILKEIFPKIQPEYHNDYSAYWIELEYRFTHIMTVARQKNIEKNLYRNFSKNNIRNNLEQMTSIEADFLENFDLETMRKEPIIFPSENWKKIFLKIDAKWSWYQSESEFCEDIASKLIHCGNKNHGKEGDRLLVLGEKIKGGFRPHLTFIVNEGVLGETKGPYNSKPNKNYHPQIVKLLLDKRIIFNLGGGYKPQNNFHLDDLDELQYNYLKNLRPDLFSLSEALKIHPILREKILSQYIDFKMEKDRIRIVPPSQISNKANDLNKLTINNYFSPFLNTKEKRQKAWLFSVVDNYDQGFTEHLDKRNFDELINSLNKENEILLKKVLKKLKANKNIDNYEIYDSHTEIVSAIEQAVGAMYGDSVRTMAEQEIIALLNEKADDFGVIIEGGKFLEDYVKFYLDINVMAKKIENDSMPNQNYFLEFLEEVIITISYWKGSLEPEYEEESFNHHAEYYLSQILEE